MARPENELKTALAKRLREIRKALGDEGREQFSARLNLPKNTLANYERGLHEPPASVILAYHTVFSVSYNWLLSGDGEMFGNATQTLHISGGLLDRKRLESAIEVVCEGLGDHILPPKTMAETVLIAYDMLQKDETSKDNIIRLIRAA